MMALPTALSSGLDMPCSSHGYDSA
uniref:Uncharacterized protein n=1 Tax=Arundo donax TaxID=35708 RepID=A0A0A8Y0H0_ARUDO